MFSKAYYHVSVVKGKVKIKPLNSREEIQQVLDGNGQRFVGYEQTDMVRLFLLDQDVNSGVFASWIQENSRSSNMNLGKPSYTEIITVETAPANR